MAELIRVGKEDLTTFETTIFCSDLERDYLMRNIVKEKKAKIVSKLNRSNYYFNGNSITTGWQVSKDSLINCDDLQLEIRGRNLIRDTGKFKYLILKGISADIDRSKGVTWLLCNNIKRWEVLKDFEEICSEYQLYRNKFITVHAGMKLSSSIKNKLDLNEIGMNHKVEKEVNAIIKMFKYSKDLKKNNLQFKRNVLLYGDFGCGKTTIINAIAKEALKYGGTVFNFSLKDSNSVDELMKIVPVIDNTFPALLILEDVDLIAKSRSNSYSGISNTILKLMEENKKFIVLASTNEVKSLDGAFVRHGRMEKVFHIYLDAKSKMLIFQNHLKYYSLRFENWKEDKEVLEFLNNSSTSGAMINSVLMCTKQDLVLKMGDRGYDDHHEQEDHKDIIKKNIKDLTWQNGSGDNDSKFII